MRQETTLPHEFIFVGRLWNPTTKLGNFDNNRKPIDTIVLHTMDGFVDGTTAWFKNPTTVPSAHYGIGLNGRLVQWLPENVVAYHSGKYEVNQRSISIEHEDNHVVDVVRTEDQYAQSARLVAEISLANNIPLDRQHVLKHNEIVATRCPGNLDVDRILTLAKALINPSVSSEPLHTYQLQPTVFINMVTKSSEYDELWKKLKLKEKDKIKVGSSQILIDEINRRYADALNAKSEAAISAVASQVPNGTGTSPALWQKSAIDVLLSILKNFKGNTPV